MAEGIIYKALSGFYYVEHAGESVECKARGRFRIEDSTPLVGDYVEFSPTEQGRGYITGLLPRKNAFVRPPVANIEKMVIVASAAVPVTDTWLIDRMTAVACKNDCQAIICINKCDLDPAKRLYDIYTAAGLRTVRMSAETGEGIDSLRDLIRGSVCVFTGNSGVGKSSILNALEPDFQISTGSVSKKLGRGRHTTRHVELYKLSCGAMVADTPGFSSFDADDLSTKDGLAHLFPEFEPFLSGCRFLDCAHIKEPDCAVTAAVETGALQRSRHESYKRLYLQITDNRK